MVTDSSLTPPAAKSLGQKMDHDLKQCLDAQFQHGMPLPLIQSCMLQVTLATALPRDLACCVTVIATLILNSPRSAAFLGPRVLP
jgi:hypothetical protein